MTVEVTDDLYRRAKAAAALRGRKLKDLVEEGLRHVVGRDESAQPRKAGELMKHVKGSISSGIGDLASNPKHLEGYGRDARRHR